MKDIRSFIAIELPEEVKSELSGLGRRLASETHGYRWVKSPAMHLTLRFLGYLGPERFGQVAKLVEKGIAADGPLTLSPRGVGCFPDERRARVVWVGLGGEVEKLQNLVAALEGSLGQLGIPGEARPFKAHLTIGRVDKDGRGSGLNLNRELLDWSAKSWKASEIVLFESFLSREGARHIERARGKII